MRVCWHIQKLIPKSTITPTASKHYYRHTMASSAGLRISRPAIRFTDEFGSSGSNPTPAHYVLAYYKNFLSMKVYKKAYNELFGPRNYEGVAIHTVRLAERVRHIAKKTAIAYMGDFYTPRIHPDCVRITHDIYCRLLNDINLTKSFTKEMLKVLAEGVMMQIFLALPNIK